MLLLLDAYRKIQVFDLGTPRRAAWYQQNIKKRNYFQLGDEEEKQTIEQTLMKTTKSSGGLIRGRGITERVLTLWTLGMIHLHNICEEVEKYYNITSVTSEQHVDMRPSCIVGGNEDVEMLIR
ncbi:hypothetical protein AVEN_124211-1 [Araneus ventricosus]|uniref:Uncharacterized protein n=1 Tax=Araneus ventricosus TaxID=182803 RepID=A0A4Y2N3V4_ARAVE|nr:hypothetical protein AVEN_124211-1 [Araneus ventricosus]